MRARDFHRLMHRLALVATLALVLVPALGRMAQACEDAAAADAFGAMCTAAGLAVDAPAPSHAHPPSHHASHDATPTLPQAPMPMPHHGDGDCDYCPLLLSIVAPKPPALVAPAIALQPAPMPVVASAPPPYAHPTGLLSRGPPARS